MGINWGGVFMGYNSGNIPSGDMARIRSRVNRIADVVRQQLAIRGINPNMSAMLVRVWSGAFAKHNSGYFATFFRSAGGSRIVAELDLADRTVSLEEFCRSVEQEFDISVEVGMAFGLEDPLSEELVHALAMNHVRQIEDHVKFTKLGSMQGLEHLAEPLKRFVADHPNYDKNVFVMMRFAGTAQMNQIYSQDCIRWPWLHCSARG